MHGYFLSMLLHIITWEQQVRVFEKDETVKYMVNHYALDNFLKICQTCRHSQQFVASTTREVCRKFATKSEFGSF